MRLHNLSKNSLNLRSIWTIVQSLEPQASADNSCCTVDCLKRGRILCIRTIPRCAILPVANSGGSLNHDCTWVGHALLSQSPHDRVFAPCAVCSPHASQHGRSEYRNRRPLFPPHCQEDCTRNSQRLLESHWIRECWPPQFRVGKLCAIFCSSKKRWSLESLEFEEHVVIAQWTFAMARLPIVDSRSVV